MIELNIESGRPIAHEYTVGLERNEIQRVRLLLSLDKLELMANEKKERQFIRTFDKELIYSVTFDDECYIKWYLCCGVDNFYDQVVFGWKDGNTIDLESTYMLDDMKITVDNHTYIIRIAEE